MNQFVLLFRTSDSARRAALGTPEQAQKSLEAWLTWIKSLETSGHLKSRGLPLDPGGKVIRGTDRVVTDGPYAEAKDILLGFITIDARDLSEAADVAMGCPMLNGDGSVEVRPAGTLAQ